MGQGAYLLGQNGNDPSSAIIFHHSNNDLCSVKLTWSSEPIQTR